MDRLLGYRRAVPTVGRVVQMTEELLEKAEKKLKKTFFISPGKLFLYCHSILRAFLFYIF